MMINKYKQVNVNKLRIFSRRSTKYSSPAKVRVNKLHVTLTNTAGGGIMTTLVHTESDLLHITRTLLHVLRHGGCHVLL